MLQLYHSKPQSGPFDSLIRSYAFRPLREVRGFFMLFFGACKRTGKGFLERISDGLLDVWHFSLDVGRFFLRPVSKLSVFLGVFIVFAPILHAISYVRHLATQLLPEVSKVPMVSSPILPDEAFQSFRSAPTSSYEVRTPMITSRPAASATASIKSSPQVQSSSSWLSLLTSASSQTLTPYSSARLNEFNRVSDMTMLSHQNVGSLIRHTFKSSRDAKIDAETGIVCYPSGQQDVLKARLMEELVKFLAQDKKKLSLAIVSGTMRDDRIEGATHWTALHFRKVDVGEGICQIKAYYADSLRDGDVPKGVEGALEECRKTASTDSKDRAFATKLGEFDVRAASILDTPHIFSLEAFEAQPARQEDGYSCGYQAVHNMKKMHDADDPSAAFVGVEKTSVDQFITASKKPLQKEFNSQPATSTSMTYPLR